MATVALSRQVAQDILSLIALLHGPLVAA